LTEEVNRGGRLIKEGKVGEYVARLGRGHGKSRIMLHVVRCCLDLLSSDSGRGLMSNHSLRRESCWRSLCYEGRHHETSSSGDDPPVVKNRHGSYRSRVYKRTRPKAGGLLSILVSLVGKVNRTIARNPITLPQHCGFQLRTSPISSLRTIV